MAGIIIILITLTKIKLLFKNVINYLPYLENSFLS